MIRNGPSSPRSIRRKPLFLVSSSPFFVEKGASGGPTEACNAEDQRCFTAAPAWRDREPPADRARRGVREVSGLGLPTPSEARGAQRLAQIAELDELELARKLYRSAGGSTPKRAPARPLPDWARVREELARRDHQVTLALVWEEYKAEHPDGYQYSQFGRAVSALREAPLGGGCASRIGRGRSASSTSAMGSC